MRLSVLSIEGLTLVEPTYLAKQGNRLAPGKMGWNGMARVARSRRQLTSTIYVCIERCNSLYIWALLLMFKFVNVVKEVKEIIISNCGYQQLLVLVLGLRPAITLFGLWLSPRIPQLQALLIMKLQILHSITQIIIQSILLISHIILNSEGLCNQQPDSVTPRQMVRLFVNFEHTGDDYVITQ